jgi:hypothetical protein
LLLRWIHPPGPTIIPLAAWVFTILSRPFIRSGGTGDLGIFQRKVLAEQKFEVVLSLLELVNRYQSTAEALEACSSILQTLQLDQYAGDYAL